VRAAILVALAIFAVPTSAVAQEVVNSESIDAISVTLYRDPGRQGGGIAAGWPGGYALITETRTIRLPAGRTIIRFQGVSQGMLPESAIIGGLPRQASEKNRDALLLSPAGLLDAHLKRRVALRRTNRVTGAVVVQDAVIEAGPGGGVVLTTPEGVEALGCSGLPESLRYASVPDGLFAEPTLSVVADIPSATTATVQLTYLAEGLDWSASYVARVADDGRTLDLFAWMTVVNGGSQGFERARTQAIAGAPNKEAAAAQPQAPDPVLHLQCWPMDVTSTHPRRGLPAPPPPPPAPESYGVTEDIVVMAQRRSESMMDTPLAVSVIMAQQEELGDLKLYRIPEAVTVAAQSRKQVAMIDRKKVGFERVYTGRFESFERDDHDDENQPGAASAELVLRTENRKTNGLGLPLPAGSVSVFETANGQSLLVGESNLQDRAVGDEVEFGVGDSPNLRYQVNARPRAGRRAPFRVRVTNARATPEVFELVIPYDVARASETLGKRKGQNVWRTTVPANGEAKLEFALRLEQDDGS